MVRKHNVILLTIDSLRPDHLGCLGYPKDVSPNIHKLAKKGVLFSQAISNGPDTPSSFPSIITSSYPRIHLSKDQENNPSWIFLSSNRMSIAEVLKRHDYSTAAFNSNPFISSFFHYDRGFDLFDDNLWPGGLDGATGKNAFLFRDADIFNKIRYRLNLFVRSFNIIRGKREAYRAEVINKKAISWLDGTKNSFFLWLHYMDVHIPHVPLKATFVERINALRLINKVINEKRFPENELRMLVKFYDDEIKYVDCEIGHFLYELERMGISHDNTYIILTADHGQQFMEHGLVCHGLLYDEILRVPLIICGPGIEKNVVVRDQVSLLDLSPTIADLLHIPEIKSFQGTSLLPLMEGKEKLGRSVISERYNRRQFSLRTEDWKYILILDKGKTFLGEAKEALYYLRKDPAEKESLIEVQKEKAEELKLQLLDHISMEDRERLETKEHAKLLSDEQKRTIRERLRTLGYM